MGAEVLHRSWELREKVASACAYIHPTETLFRPVTYTQIVICGCLEQATHLLSCTASENRSLSACVISCCRVRPAAEASSLTGRVCEQSQPDGAFNIGNVDHAALLSDFNQSSIS